VTVNHRGVGKGDTLRAAACQKNFQQGRCRERRRRRGGRGGNCRQNKAQEVQRMTEHGQPSRVATVYSRYNRAELMMNRFSQRFPSEIPLVRHI